MGTKKRTAGRKSGGEVGGAAGGSRGGGASSSGTSGAASKVGDNPGTSKSRVITDVNGNVRTYFKVFANFKCSNERCKKTWSSAHAWEREDDDGGINCEVCGKAAELLNAVDEMLKLDTYICQCENLWQSIHVQENNDVAQECDICHLMVTPDGPPQERFGRHYWLKCLNAECPEKGCVEWEDFSLTTQKTQRCTKCFSRGDIFKISKLRQLPFWLYKRRLQVQQRLPQGAFPDMEERPSNHVTEFCDMCQDIIRQHKGKNCRQWRLIKTKLVPDHEGGGTEKEEIVEMRHQSENPFHFDEKGSIQVLQKDQEEMIKCFSRK